ncbi:MULTISPECIES: hypothetical protein [unclassified Pseudonocardia]|jgi:hypothetical protein|uniref:hypothetical protein n=1 Tax=unclassified Pseudonocardia TaxID=2619320 RepID=UPI00095CA8C3|nr:MULTISPECIES: hypothetical protein [unclassified Pseudonocardia]MBN9100662.1 hypothetical protein [Pseudonocardia sp.]OJY47698.1 MAG: hypothetical protein BGP03_33825 [Pseudonocardia sp. 73-21]
MPDPLSAESKADFSTIYTQTDPRGYFRTLRLLDYQVPQHAKPVIEAALEASGNRTVLDVCCSYGINAALLRLDVDLETLGARAADPARVGLDPESVITSDAAFHAEHLRRPDLTVLGLDASAPAIDYGVRTGLLANGWAEDLESTAPSPALATGLRDVGLVVCTGGVGYVGRDTFARILGAVGAPQQLRLAVFVLRVFDYTEISAVFEPYGLVTEKLPGTYRQRRFADRGEQDAAVHDVRARGLDPTGKEAAGWYHADCWLTRPVTAAPVRIPPAAG